MFSRKQLFLMAISGTAVVLLFLAYLASQAYKKSATTTTFFASGSIQNDSALPNSNTTAVSVPSQGRPLRLKIPTLNVDAAIEDVGLTTAGAMDVPQRPNDVAWFNLGARPGEPGSAVLAGHRDWYNGKKAVFYDLHKLRPGETMSIEDDLGQSATFVVREIRVYDAKADAPKVFAADAIAHLNLVTCIGAWNISKKSYSQRLVVFTDIAQ